MDSHSNELFVIAREPGAENPAIPTWACRSSNPANLDLDYSGPVSRREVDSVPGAFQLLNLLAVDECARLVNLTESLGYLVDAAVSLPRSIRHNHNVTWIADDQTHDIIWRRAQSLIYDERETSLGKQALGLNARFRFYRYAKGDYFGPHTDGSWPGSRVVDGELVANASSDRWSQLTFLLFLSDDYQGGRTQFYVNKDDPAQPARTSEEVSVIKIRTPIGAALCFPHGMHPLHRLHSSEEISSGTKYIIRSDVLFEL